VKATALHCIPAVLCLPRSAAQLRWMTLCTPELFNASLRLQRASVMDQKGQVQSQIFAYLQHLLARLLQVTVLRNVRVQWRAAHIPRTALGVKLFAGPSVRIDESSTIRWLTLTSQYYRPIQCHTVKSHEITRSITALETCWRLHVFCSSR